MYKIWLQMTLSCQSLCTLRVFAVCLSTMGNRALSYFAPSLQNALPPESHNTDLLLTFKSQLKTHLFKLVFSL